jgi:hypothetical protein
MNKVFFISIIQATTPIRLSKLFYRNADGALLKSPGGQLVEGMYMPHKISCPASMATLIGELKPSEALVFGTAGNEKQAIYSRNAAPSATALTRTADRFDWPDGLGVWLLDNDSDPRPGAKQTNMDGFRSALTEVCPILAETPAVFAHSSSSFIFDSETDRSLKGEGGHHGYVFVQDARDIPRAGKALVDRLWLAGHGYCIVSKSGQILERSLIDSSVWQPHRLCFSAGAACAEGLIQRRPAPLVVNDDAPALDTRVALSDLTTEERTRLAELKARARAAVAEEAAEVRWQWTESNTHRILVEQGKSASSHPEDAAKIREVYLNAATHGDLYGPFELEAEDGTLTTVDVILSDLDAWHGRRFHDPLERDYGCDPRIAYLNTRNTRGPCLYSHAHGGRRFLLRHERCEHLILAGERLSAIATALKAFRQAGSLYERNGEIVRVTEDGEVMPLNLQGILLELDRHVRWLRKAKKIDAGVVPCDCPRSVADGVIATRGEWGLPKLRAVATAPTMDPLTGRLIERDGYDSETGILIVCGELNQWRSIAEHPTLAMVRAALERLWHPFKDFPFCGAVDRGVFMAALLSAVIRALLPTCPGFAFVASTAGSGKSLLARCISILAGCIEDSVMANAQDKEEMRKRLLAVGRRGAAALTLDNINTALESDVLCAWLTSEYLTERILGHSQDDLVRTSGLILMTGNNLRLKGDLCRRILVSRIEPGLETPWRRSFDLDPAAYCRKHRLTMVTDALLVLRHYLAQPSVLTDRTASFEAWSDCVRRTVAGIAADSLMDMTDPVAAIENSYAEDPDTLKIMAMLSAWEAVFGAGEVTTKALLQAVEKGVIATRKEEPNRVPDSAIDALKAVVIEIAGEGRSINPRLLGRWIAGHVGRIVQGRRLVKGKLRDGYQTWSLLTS